MSHHHASGWSFSRISLNLQWIGGILLLVICLANPASAQTTHSDPAEPADAVAAVSENESAHSVTIAENASKLGFDLKKLQAIDPKFDSQVEKGQVVGCSALIMKNGEEVYFGKWGYQDQKQKIPIQRDTIFRVYSMTKPIVSVAAMTLVEQGKLDLDLPVTEYLPEFADLKVLETKDGNSIEVPPRREMTTRDLMRHTSGLTYGFFGDTEVDRRYRQAGVLMSDRDLKSTVTKLGKIPLLNHPGSRFHYSASTDVLGRVIEVVSEQKLDQYLNQVIFEPLGMEDTFFTVPKDKQGRLAQLYRPGSNGSLVEARAGQSARFVDVDNKYYSGGGGLCSTLDDYMKFCRMLLGAGTAGDVQVLKPETVEQMLTNQLDKIENSPGAAFKFGLGFQIFPNGDHGWGGAAGTRFWVNPKKQMAIIYMVQIIPYGRRAGGNVVRAAAH